MKAIFAFLMSLFLAAGAHAQAVNPNHGIGRVDQDHEDSAEYVARTPYTLEWSVDKRYKLYGKNDPLKVDSYLAGIHVYDVVTGRLVAKVGQSALNGSMKIPVAGKHRVKVFCTGAVNLSFTEDKAALETAARRGELKEGVTVAEADKTSLRSRTERIAAAKAELLSLLATKKISESKKAEIRLAAERAAQLASDEDDFGRRFLAIAGDLLK